jgi:hypothetical protein
MKYLAIVLVALLPVCGFASNPVPAGGDTDVDFQLSNLSLTAGTEKSFQFSFNLTNNGSSATQGYALKLIFSTNQTLDAGDDFFLTFPLVNGASQAIGANQTVAKNVQYTATSPVGYLPAGNWYVFAEINHDRAVIETNYTNNTVWSLNQINVPNYGITFTTAPTVTNITAGSFALNVVFDPDMTRIYYRVLADASPAPDKAALLSGNGLFPWENQVTVSGLGPAFGYDVYVMGEFYDQKVTVIHKLDVLTGGTASPALVLSHTSLALASTAINTNSASEVYSLSGYHLTGNATVAANGNFRVSKDDIVYASQISFLATALNNGNSQWVYVKYVADENAGVKAGTVANSSSGAATKNLPVSVSVFDPASGNFDGLTSLGETGWSAYSITGYHVWSLVDLEISSPSKRTEGENKAIQIDGSLNGFTVNEDWLISPEMDLSGFSFEPTLHVSAFSSGGGPTLKLKYSANYSGTGNPTMATWFDAPMDFPAVNSNAWKNSTATIPNKESKIFFAFVYTSTGSAGSRWTLDNWRISDNLLNIPSQTLAYTNVQVGTSSPSKPLQVQISGYGDVTVAVTAPFEISTNNTNFSSSVVLPESGVAAGMTMYIRFNPATEVNNLVGTITFTGLDLLVEKNTLVGTSMLVTAVSEVLNSSGLIYPNPTDGAVHIDIALLDNQGVEFSVMITNSIGSTVASTNAPVTALEDVLSGFMSGLQPGLYYVTLAGDAAIYRNKVVKR